MSRTAITPTTVNRTTGASLPTASAADVANGNQCSNDGNVLVLVTNTDTVSHNFTVTTGSAVDGLAAPTRQVAIPGNTSVPIAFGPYPVSFYGTTLLFNGDNVNIKVQILSLPRN